MCVKDEGSLRSRKSRKVKCWQPERICGKQLQCAKAVPESEEQTYFVQDLEVVGGEEEVQVQGEEAEEGVDLPEGEGEGVKAEKGQNLSTSQAHTQGRK